MKKTIKKKWIEALESGEYKQGLGRLRRQDFNYGLEAQYCCLGVLCDVLHKHKMLEKFKFVNGKCRYSDTKLSCELPSSLLKDLDMTYKQQEKLISMNDADGRSFKQIASYIKRYL